MNNFIYQDGTTFATHNLQLPFNIMFNKAYNIANKYTQPFIVLMRFMDGTVESGLGSYVIINHEGWAMTAAHNFSAVFGFNQHQPLIKQYQDTVKIIQDSTTLNDEEKQQQIGALNYHPKWITHYSIMLSGKNVNIFENFIYGEHDIAFFRMDTDSIPSDIIYPKLINHQTISPGTSLCKLGYPFVEFKGSFDETTHQFSLPPNLLPVPLFPIEGIYTRNFFKGRSEDKTTDVLFLETSSPGLKGQSGGPIFDTEGNIYAIQSQNLTIPLGFAGLIHKDGKGIEENQFLNLGIGVHPKTIETLLYKHGINYERAAS